MLLLFLEVELMETLYFVLFSKEYFLSPVASILRSGINGNLEVLFRASIHVYYLVASIRRSRINGNLLRTRTANGQRLSLLFVEVELMETITVPV